MLRAFFDSYNRHDLAGVLATLAESFAYGDCGFATRQMLIFETIEDLTAWLRVKFAEGDRFRVKNIIIAPAEGSPASDPRSTMEMWIVKQGGEVGRMHLKQTCQLIRRSLAFPAETGRGHVEDDK